MAGHDASHPVSFALAPAVRPAIYLRNCPLVHDRPDPRADEPGSADSDGPAAAQAIYDAANHPTAAPTYMRDTARRIAVGRVGCANVRVVSCAGCGWLLRQGAVGGGPAVSAWLSGEGAPATRSLSRFHRSRRR